MPAFQCFVAEMASPPNSSWTGGQIPAPVIFHRDVVVLVGEIPEASQIVLVVVGL